MIIHEGFEQFRKGIFENGGDNLFVDANGVIRRIADNDLDGDGLFDVVFPNSHGYIERSPTTIFKRTGQEYQESQLPHDSCWKAFVEDIDGDGYLDLLICNGENGVSSELNSYIYWGGENGLTGERTELPTIGAYDAVIRELFGNGKKDIIFTSAWFDHHNAGVLRPQTVYYQTEPRKFVDMTQELNILGSATQALVCTDLNGDGYPDLVLANLRSKYEYDTDSMIYWGTADGFSKDPQLLPTHSANCLLAVDLNQDGYPELIVTGDHQLCIYWNRAGILTDEDVTRIHIEGLSWQFSAGALPVAAADLDDDGIIELVIGTKTGVEIRKATELDKVYKKLGNFGVSGVWIGNITDSGYKDIIACQYNNQRTYDVDSYVYWGGIDGYKEENRTAFPTHGAMNGIAADLDGDGIKELIFCNTMAGPAQADPEFPVFVYSDNGNRDFTQRPRKNYPVDQMAYSYVSADFNNDGFVDLAVTTAFGWRLFEGTAEGPDPEKYIDFPHPGKCIVTGILAADINRDGWLDVLVCTAAQGKDGVDYHAIVYLGSKEGFSNERVQFVKSQKFGESIGQCIMLSDLNGDGWLDFVYGEPGGNIAVYYGSAEGFVESGFRRINLKDCNGAHIMGLTSADIDHDGKKEMIVTTAGHYTRRKSYLYILRDEANGFPEAKQSVFETGGTTGFPALADLQGRGELDLVLPFYSTTESRVLPLRIFSSDGKGNFDWDHPFSIECPSSIAAMAVDLNESGYPDLFVCCHRNDVGHIVDSMLLLNDGQGPDLEHPQKLLGYGPHCFTLRNQGNGTDRSENESYISPVFQVNCPKKLRWEGKTPGKTSLSFLIRFGKTESEIHEAEWLELGVAQELQLPENTSECLMQYKAVFKAPACIGTPELYKVEIE